MRYLPILFLSILMIGCSSESAIEKSVKSYLADANEVEASSISLNNLSDFAPYLASDSLKVLQAQLEAEKDEIRQHLNEAVAASKKAIEAGNEAKAGGFSALDDMIDQTLDQAKLTLAEAEAGLKQLDGDLSGTAMEPTVKAIEAYEARGDELLFYMVNGTWSTGEGEEKPFRLMTGSDKSTILGSAI